MKIYNDKISRDQIRNTGTLNCPFCNKTLIARLTSDVCPSCNKTISMTTR